MVSEGPSYDARDIVGALQDVDAVLSALGLLEGAKRQRGGRLIRCPWHQEHTPSCSVQLVGGKILAHCFACGGGGDVIALAQAALGLDFQAALEQCAGLAGIVPAATWEGRRRAKPLTRAGTRDRGHSYPPRHEVVDLWNTAAVAPAVGSAPWRYLVGRGIADPSILFDASLCLALPASSDVPSWARIGGRPWVESGHRLLVPLYDAAGWLRSMVARDITGEAKAKSVVPAGHTARGLVMANIPAQNMLDLHDDTTAPVVITEGEIDFLTACWKWPKYPVFGVRSGSWEASHGERVPRGRRVVIRTDHDTAGDAYAERIAKTLQHCVVERA